MSDLEINTPNYGDAVNRPHPRDLVENSVPIGVLTGVYFLMWDGKIVYVGQTTNLHFRIGQHLTEGVKEFNRYAFLPLPPHMLDEIEDYYIDVCLPKYNVSRRRTRRDPPQWHE